jgi:hypothetical protein
LPLGDADAGRQEQRGALDPRGVGEQRGAQALGHRLAASPWPRHQHEELLAAEAAEGVDLAQLGLERRRGVLQRAVAGRMAVAIVDGLEVVEVEHEHGERLSGAPAALHLAKQRLFHRPAVEQAGQAVVARAMAQVGEEAADHEADQRRMEGQRDHHVGDRPSRR